MNSRNFKGAVKSPLHTQNNYLLEVLQLRLLLFLLLSRNPPQSQIGTLPTLPLLALFALPSFRCAKWPGSLRTRVVQHVGGYSYSHLNYSQNVALLFVSSYSAALLGFHCQVIWRCNRQLTRLISPCLKPGALRRFPVIQEKAIATEGGAA